jgi:murein L,D-transpeptidase YcbB/YkuD
LVHFIYQTAWVDDNGELNFREDIYGFDDQSIPYMQVNKIGSTEDIRKFVVKTND